MHKKIEKDLEELSVNIFVNEYGLLRSVYNRLYAIIHVYYSGRRQLADSEETITPEKLLQMRKDIAMRLERVDDLTRDQQFPQDHFAVFAKDKLAKMHVAIGVMETASLIGELSSYSQTIMDYMQSCCNFATKFIPILSDPANQNLQAVKNNLITFLKQIDLIIQQRQIGEQEKAQHPASVHRAVPIDPSQNDTQQTMPATYFVATEQETPSPLIACVYEALNVLEKIDLFQAKSSLGAEYAETNDTEEIIAELDEQRQRASSQFQAFLVERYGSQLESS